MHEFISPRRRRRRRKKNMDTVCSVQEGGLRICPHGSKHFAKASW